VLVSLDILDYVTSSFSSLGLLRVWFLPFWGDSWGPGGATKFHKAYKISKSCIKIQHLVALAPNIICLPFSRHGQQMTYNISML